MVKSDEQKAQDSKAQAEERRKTDTGKPDSEIGFGGTWISDIDKKDTKDIDAGK